MAQATKEQLRRERTQAYEAALDAARPAVGVMALFARGRESRAGAQSLEEAFAAAGDGADSPRLPAAVWVALRQGDVDATIDALVTASSEQFLIAAHEQLDAGYRLTTVEERRGLPDVERLQAQVADVLQLPRDVVAIIAEWGPEDPRTGSEIVTLLDQRFGPAADAESPGPAPARRDGTELRMSSSEFAAMLSLTPEQSGVLTTLVRQAGLVIAADE